MAQLTYQITGDLTGLASAADGAKGILNNLQAQAEKLNIKLFGAETQKDIESIGGALTIVTGKINEYMTAAIQGSAAFKDQSAQAALDALSTKITVLTGNAELFGESIKNQQAQISAYQQAINKILAQGFGPLDARVVSLKTNVDRLTSSIEAQKNAAKTFVDPFAKFQTSGSLIKDAESKVKNLTTALRDATNTQDIAKYNVRLIEAKANLDALNNSGKQAAQGVSPFGKVVTQELESGSTAVSKLGRGLGSAFGTLRTIAYILPGIGIAGIFNLGFEAIAKATEGLNLFGQKFDANKVKIISDAQEVLDALEKQKKAVTTFNTTLSAGSQVNAAASDGYGQEIVKLDLLFSSIRKNTQARYENGTAIQEVQKLYPDIFGSLTNEEFLTNKAKVAYDKLRDSIIQTATVQAGLKLAGESLEENVKDTIALTGANDKITAGAKVYNDLLAKRNALQKQVNAGQDPNGLITNQISAINVQLNDQYSNLIDLVKVQREFQNAATGSYNKVQLFLNAAAAAQKKLNQTEPVKSGILLDLENQLKSLQAIRPTIKVQADLDLNTKQIKEVQDKIDKLGGVKGLKNLNTGQNSYEALNKQLDDIYRKTKIAFDQSGLVGYALEVQKINDKYTEQDTVIQSVLNKQKELLNKGQISQKQFGVAQKKAQNDFDATDEAKQKELDDLAISEQLRTAQEIQRIKDEFGVKATQTRAREIAAINTLADSEIIKAQGNEKKLEAIEQGRTTATQAVNDNYQLIISQTYEKINDIVAQGNANQTDTEARKIAKISVQYDKLTQQVNKYYADLKTLQSQGDVSLQGRDLNAEQQNSDAQLQKAKQLQISIVLSATFSKALQGSIDTFANDFYSTIVNLGKTRADIDNKYLADLANATDQSAKDQINKIHDLELATTTSFGAIFSSLVSKFNQTFSQSIVQSFVKKLTDGFGETLISAPLGLGKADPAVSLSNAGVSFSQTVIAAGQAFAASAVGSTIPLTSSITDSGHEFEHATTTGSAEVKTGLSKGAAGLIAAGSVLGSLVSGLGKPTNSATSALGGALSGAAEGAAIGTAFGPGIGTAIGAVAGGLIGGIAGLFGASKARKALQEQQLEQAKEQTALLQAANAYTSQIIGRQTSNGIISGISVGSTGQLVAIVSGSDLQFVLDRNAKSR